MPKLPVHVRPAWAGPVLFAVVSALLLWPIWFSVHPEGFSAQIQIAAIARYFGLLDRANLLYPVHAEYFYLSRAGVVLMLEGLMQLTGRTDDSIFRVLMVLSFALWIAASVAFARRRGGIGAWWAAAAMLMTPGIAELPFTFNDNIVSAAYGALALALTYGRRDGSHQAAILGAARHAVVGALLAIAILCRPDALLLLPLVVCVACMDGVGPLQTGSVLASLACGLVSGLLVLQQVSGSTVSQAVAISRFFESLHTHAGDLSELMWTPILFFGLPQLALIPIGATLAWRRSKPPRWLHRLALIVAPAGLLAYALAHSLETRQFYPLLAPYVAVFGGQALRWLLSSLAQPTARLRYASYALLTGTMAVWLSPPLYVRLRDGPRMPFGRLASPFIWRDWQRMVLANRIVLERLVDTADLKPEMTFLTTFFDTDHYLRLTLWQHGYVPERADEAYASCRGGFEAWTSASSPAHKVFHIRLENPHVSQRPFAYVQAIQLQRAFACAPLRAISPIGIIGIGQNSPEPRANLFWALLHPAPGRDQVMFGWHPYLAARIGRAIRGASRQWLAPQTFDRQRVEFLTSAALPSLMMETDRVVTSFDGEVPPGGYDRVMSRYAAQVAWPRYKDGRAIWIDRRRDDMQEPAEAPAGQ